jgi:hypothetical protein
MAENKEDTAPKTKQIGEFTAVEVLRQLFHYMETGLIVRRNHLRQIEPAGYALHMSG